MQKINIIGIILILLPLISLILWAFFNITLNSPINIENGLNDLFRGLFVISLHLISFFIGISFLSFDE